MLTRTVQRQKYTPRQLLHLHVQATSVEAENPSAHIKFLTEPNQPQNFKFPAQIKISKGSSNHHGLISSNGCIMMLILTQHFASPVLKHFKINRQRPTSVFRRIELKIPTLVKWLISSLVLVIIKICKNHLVLKTNNNIDIFNET